MAFMNSLPFINTVRAQYAGRTWTWSKDGYSPVNNNLSSPSSSIHEDNDFAEKGGVFGTTLRSPSRLYNTINFERVRPVLCSVLLAGLPTFLQKSPAKKGHRKTSPTAYLDGVRGVASLIVVIHHWSLAFTSSAARGWKSREDIPDNWLFQLPLLRVVHSGRFMVGIFFVLSGYVLSYKGLKLGREGEVVKLLDSLSSSVFRRWIRLSLPVIISCFIGLVCARYALWHDMPDGWEHWEGGTHHSWNPLPYPVPEGDFKTQFWDWYYDTLQLVDPFRYGEAALSRYNINILWTIPTELMGSFLVFITVLGLARCKPWVKIATLSTMIYWCHHTVRWQPALFLIGLLIAELSFLRTTLLSSSIVTKLQATHLGPPLRLCFRIFWSFVFLAGLFIGSYPQEAAQSTPLYITLMAYTPLHYGENLDFWLTVGGPLTILALENASYLQRPFASRFAQYLGKISFSLYLLHFIVMSTLGQWLVPRCMDVTGGWENGQLGFNAGMLLAIIVCGPVTLWVSDVYTVQVDEKSVRFARWVNSWAIIPLEGEQKISGE